MKTIRMFLSKLLKPERPKPITTMSIVEACDKASRRLNDLLGTHDVKVQLATSGNDLRTYTNHGQQWGKSQFDWINLLSPRPFSHSPTTYVLALYKANTLCGLCESGLGDNGFNSLEIQLIEKAPSHAPNPLQGFTIAAFSAVNLELAKEQGIPSIVVDTPHPKTRKSYRRLGYRFNAFAPSPLSVRVKPTTELNWDRLIAHRAQQAVTPTAHDHRPLTPAKP